MKRIIGLMSVMNVDVVNFVVVNNFGICYSVFTFKINYNSSLEE